MAAQIRDMADSPAGAPGASAWKSEGGTDVWTMTIREQDGDAVRTTELRFAPDSALPDPPPTALRLLRTLLTASAGIRSAHK